MSISDKRTGSILLIEGLDVSKPAEYISDSASSNVQNFEVKESLLSKRIGSSVVGAVIGGTEKEIMTARQFVREGVAYNVRFGLDKAEYYTGTTWSDISGTTWTAEVTDVHCTAVPLLSGKEILCITNGIDPIHKWTATGNTSELGGTPPRAKYIQEYKTYLVCANITGGTDISQRVQWSDTADPETWTGGNSGSVDLIEDGGEITGLNLYGNYVCVHKESSIYLGYLVSSSAIFQFDRRATGVGTVANNSIVNLPTGEQIFLAKDGLRIFNGITAPLIEAPINDEIRSSLNSQYANRAYGVLVREKDEVWIGIPIGSQERGETIYKFNYNTRALYRDTRANCSFIWRGSSTGGLSWDEIDVYWDDYDYRWDDVSFITDSDQINFAYSTGYVTKQINTSLDDNGTTIDAIWDSKDYQDSQDRLARWKRMQLWASGGTVSCYYSIDEGATWTEMTGSPYTLSSTMPSHESPINLYFDTVSSKLRVRFRNQNSEPLKIKQFIIEYSPREYRR